MPSSSPRARTGRFDALGAAEAVVDLGAVYTEHADAVARWVGRLAGPRLDIEDIVHEVFLVAHRRLPEFRGDAKITTWLYEITVRIVQDRRRRQRRWHWVTARRTTRAVLADMRPTEEAAKMASDQPNALELLEKREATAALYEILDGLSDKYRTAIILFELEGLTGQEIAEITQTSIANVWIRLFRGRRQFLDRFLAWEAKKNP